MELLIGWGPPIAFFIFVIVSGIVRYIVNKIRAEREGREVRGFVRGQFVVAVTWSGMIATLMMIIPAFSTGLSIFLFAVAAIYVAAGVIAFSVSLIISKVKKHKLGVFFKNWFISAVAAVIPPLYAYGFVVLYVMIFGGDPCP